MSKLPHPHAVRVRILNELRAKGDYMSNVCNKCGGELIGDGYTSVVHCENADEDMYCGLEPDANIVECRG